MRFFVYTIFLLALHLQPSLQQVEFSSPLAGQNLPNNATTAIYVSVFVDRMFDIDDILYRHEEIFSFYISWYDPTARQAILDSTAKASADPTQPYTCNKPCNSAHTGLACCDSLYLPTFIFRNVVEFPTVRTYDIRVLSNDTVLWNVYVHAVYYQTLDFHHYPFDSFKLLALLQFQSNAPTDKGHPGVELYSSAAGTRMFTIGRGDAVSRWDVNGINLTVVEFPIGQYFNTFATIKSNPNDPLQLAGVYGTEPEIASIQTQWLAIGITVSRYTSFPIMQSILPVSICAFLGLAVAFVPMRDLPARLELVVVLFLALTAVQFVLAGVQPATSYVIPTQQFILATYVLLALIAVESVVVHKLCMAKDQAQQERVQREARERVTSTMKLQRMNENISRTDRGGGGGGRRGRLVLPDTMQDGGVSSSSKEQQWKFGAGCGLLLRRCGYNNNSDGGSGGNGDSGRMTTSMTNSDGRQTTTTTNGNGGDITTSASTAIVPGLMPPPLASPANSTYNNDDDNIGGGGVDVGGAKNSNNNNDSSTKEKLTWWKAAQEDEAFAEDLARRIDLWAIVALGVCYIITAVLIFTLQQGYIPLFDSTLS